MNDYEKSLVHRYLGEIAVVLAEWPTDADAAYGKAIRPFAEAAEKAIMRYRRFREHPELGAAWTEPIKGTETDNALLHASTLRLASDPPKSTLAWQGEKLKAFIDEFVDAGVDRKHKVDILKAMVDAIVAEKEVSDAG